MSQHSDVVNSLVEALTKPDVKLAKSIIDQYLLPDNDYKGCWSDIVSPALYKIGELWQNTTITVGQEHTATSICQLILSEHYLAIAKYAKNVTPVIVMTSPKELHQVGVRMLADLIELQGIPVELLTGAPDIDDICKLIQQSETDFVIISTTIQGNLPATKELITKLKEKLDSTTFTIVIGGQAYSMADAADDMGAHLLISSPEALIETILTSRASA